jgi:hypothetical protein
MSSFADPYEDTLRSMRTGGGRASNNPLFGSSASPAPSQKSSFTDYLPWGRKREETQSSTFVSWPAWSQSGAPATSSSYFETFGLTMMQRYAAFAFFVLAAVLLLFLAFMHMPFVALSPGKFAVPFCLCTAFLVLSFGFLHGFVSYAKHLFSPGRWAYSAALAGTTCFTMWAALGAKGYLLTVVGTVMQLVAMICYFVSYVPGGPAGLSMFGSMISATVKSQFSRV